MLLENALPADLGSELLLESGQPPLDALMTGFGAIRA